MRRASVVALVVVVVQFGFFFFVSACVQAWAGPLDLRVDLCSHTHTNKCCECLFAYNSVALFCVAAFCLGPKTLAGASDWRWPSTCENWRQFAQAWASGRPPARRHLALTFGAVRAGRAY